jgi:putative ABC transport system permease protein
MSVWSRLTNVFRSGRLERDLDSELQFHIEERIRELVATGVSRADAAAHVARRFGNALRLREQSRDVKLLPWLDSILRDVRLGVRMLRKNAGVTAAVVMSLALALGACVSAFSLVDALILRPLPVPHPEQLIYLSVPTYNTERPETDTFTDPVFLRLRDAGRGQVDLFAMSTQVIKPATFAPGGDKEPVRTQYVSGDAFEKLGVASTAGRLFTNADDARPGENAVAIVSHAFWMRRFGGDPAVVGRSFGLDGRQFQIVGVTEQALLGVEPGRPTDVWLPYAMYNPRAFGNFSFSWFRVMGRLNEDVTLQPVQSVLQAAFTNQRRERALGAAPDQSPESIARFVGTPLYIRSAANGPSPLRRQFERSLWILACIAALVLLVAGSNVANLFLARTSVREREMSLRLSIGAGRGRLIQQVLIESGLVAVGSCAIGLVFASLAAPAVVSMLTSASDPVQLDLRADWRLAGFVGLLTLVTTALFGLAPAVHASGVAPVTALSTGGARSGIRARAMRPFVVVQIAFSLVVLFVGSLLVLSFTRLSHVNPGFAMSDVLLVSLEAVQRVEPAQERAALINVLDRIRGISGVQAASFAEFSVLGRAWTHYVRIPGTDHDTIEATMAPVGPGFFDTMRIPLRAGRVFDQRDMDKQNGAPVIVNEAFATRYFGHEPAIGHSIDAQFADETTAQHEVVGVVADTRYDLRKPAAPSIYVPLTARRNGTLHARIAGDATALTARIRDEVPAANPIFRVTSVTPQSKAVDQTLLRERLLALLSGFFAIVGLVLAAVGLYGVLSYAVMQRTREIGIRVVLGARPRRVVRMVLSDAGGATLIGIATGLAGGLYLSRLVDTLVFEVTPLDFWSLALPLGTLLLSAAAAATIPVLRIARLDPVTALREN